MDNTNVKIEDSRLGGVVSIHTLSVNDWFYYEDPDAEYERVYGMVIKKTGNVVHVCEFDVERGVIATHTHALECKVVRVSTPTDVVLKF